ncbi:uncharacterized protein PAC_19720 [Phialocephala subalpina]|uniref:Uncharacterized protein n=1 Tax=Phialocephala subalpina TaxID=576137 RepID=A0A1L7XXT3_9HELO|nr:uncharacterized protein PAC_19720 [Phialocephala subalpina]
MRRLKPFFSTLEEFGAAFDVISNTYSLALAPLWGGLRVILMLSKKFNKVFDSIVDVLVRIDYDLPRFRTYQRIFGHHQRIIAALSLAYLDIITLCGEIKVFIRGIQKSRLKSLAQLFGPLEHHLSEATDRFRLHRDDIELEAGACHMIESAKHYDIEVHNRELATIERTAQMRTHLRSLLSPINCSEKQRKILKTREAGTGEWIFCDQNYQLWQSSQDNSILSIFGIPGCGKTVLSSCLIQKISQAANPRNFFTYHYCDYKVSRSLNPMIIAGSLINGLLDNVEITDELSSLIVNVYQDGKLAPLEDDVFRILDLVLEGRPDTTVHAVIDGIDEMFERDRPVLFRFLKHFMECKHSMIKMCITSRADTANMISPSSSHSYRVHVAQSNISSDINIFVRNAVTTLVSSNELIIGDPSLQETIIERLSQGAKGMFLWVTFQLDSLLECLTDASIQAALDNLPRDLNETYQRLLGRIENLERRVLVHRMLQWLVCARRLLQIDELLEGIAFTVEDGHWDSAKIPLDYTRLIRASGNLVVVDDEDQSVQLAHYTVRQYLLDPPSKVSLGPGFSFQFLREDAERYVGEICITYLCFTDFETQLTRYTNRTKKHMAAIERALLDSHSIVPGGIVKSAPGLRPKYELLGYVVNEWLYHTRNLLLEETENTQRTASARKIWRQFPDLVYRKSLLFKLRPWEEARITNPQLPDCPLICWAIQNDHFSLLKSVAENTPVLLSEYFRGTAEWFGSWNNPFLAGDSLGIVDISRIPLPDLQEMTKSPDHRALFYFLHNACTRGATTILKLRYNNSEAVRRGPEQKLGKQVGVIALLQTRSVEFDGTSREAQHLWKDHEAQLLIDAAHSGNLNVVKVMFTVMRVALHDRSNIVMGERVMMQAIDCGHTNIMTYLLDQGVTLNNPLPWRLFYDDRGYSRRTSRTLPDIVEMSLGCFALHIAIAQDDPSMVKLLLEAEADPDLCVVHFRNQKSIVNRRWKSPLAHAAAAGNIEIAGDLIHYGANLENQYVSFHDLNDLQLKYTTPLIEAAIAGNTEMIHYLLECGAEIDNYDFTGRTALAAAAASAHLDAVLILLENLASVSPEMKPPREISLASPVVEAIRGNKAILKAILDNGVKLNPWIQRKMPLIIAIERKELEMAQMLIEYGANVNGDERRRDHLGWKSIPLCVAIESNQIEMVEMLLNHGADIYWKAGWDLGGTAATEFAGRRPELGAAQLVLRYQMQSCHLLQRLHQPHHCSPTYPPVEEQEQAAMHMRSQILDFGSITRPQILEMGEYRDAGALEEEPETRNVPAASGDRSDSHLENELEDKGGEPLSESELENEEDPITQILGLPTLRDIELCI